MTHPCGCYTGVWMAVTPPPQCDGTNCSLRPPAVIDPSMTAGIKIMPTGPAENLIAKLIEAIHTEAGKAEAAGDDGAHDAWQLALESARYLRQLIAYALGVKSS